MARKAFLLRLSQKLYDGVHAWAEDEFRSVNGQIEFILREAVKKRKGRDVEEDNDEPERTRRKRV